MIATIRSEWIKLRTIRMNTVLVSIAVAFPLVVGVLIAVFVDPDDLDLSSLWSGITGTSVVTAMLLGVVGAATITGEFGFGTIRPTFAATPKRGRVVLAKAVVTAVVAVVVVAVTVAITLVVTTAVASSRGATIGGTDDDTNLVPAFVGLVAFAAIVALLGLGLGLVIRSTPAAVSVLILWPLLVENIVAGILIVSGVEGAVRWMPYSAGINLGNPDPGDDTLGRVGGGLYFAAVTGAVVLIGTLVTRRRDA